DLKLDRVAVVHDKKVYGQGLSSIFADDFRKSGGTIVATETVNPGDKDFSAVISKLQPRSPQMVYYGGEYPESSLLSNQMKAKGLRVPLMGGDGMFDPTYIKNAGKASEGDYATSVGAPAASLPSAKAFISAYDAAGYREPYSAYGPQSYDSAKAILEALPGKDRIDDSVRREVVSAMGGVSFQGATGRVAFDEYGDNVTKILTVYRVRDGRWTTVKTGTFWAPPP
ncbi:MAG TPA: branched-chain amino acid ABC transporter substrate-binding protein, partial [Mycobacteriales bacterium]|nr:branched-chain amino acid ABC transporter substrate-binding protein [Mycobacteriales bacterium]